MTTRWPGCSLRLRTSRPSTFEAPDPNDAGPASSAGLLRTALRIGFRASAGPFRSLARLAVEPRAYQLVPLLMALRQDTVRMLISDDVGIGKTVEAALIAAELLEQGDASGLAVLCSPALAEQWQQELASKFGIAAELVLPSTIRRLEKGLIGSETLFERYPNVVVSTDFIKRPGLREQFWHGCPDLLIIDEAHTCVSDGTGGRSRMLRHELVERLARDEQRHLILVTATPHSGKEDGFRNLLSLLQPALKYVDLETVAGRELLAQYFVQRRRVDIRKYLDESTPFPEDRETAERKYALGSAYKELFDDVLAYARETVRDPGGGAIRQRVRYWSALALLRALASSPRAAAATLTTRADNLDTDDEAEADRLGRAAVMDLPDEETIESADATPGADADTEAGDTPHRRRLKRFAARARALEGADDRKLLELEKATKELLLDGFNPVIFCRFIDTAEYVADYLAKRLGNSYAVTAVTGTLPPDERMARIRALADDDLSAPRPGGDGLPVRGREPAGPVPGGRPLRPGVEPDPARAAGGPGRPVRADRARRAGGHDLRRGQRHRRDRARRAAPQARADPQGPGHLRPGAGPSPTTWSRRSWRACCCATRSRSSSPSTSASSTATACTGSGSPPPRRSASSSPSTGRRASTRRRYRGSWGRCAPRLGPPLTCAAFTEEALRALRADVTPLPDGFKAATGALPAGLADALVPGHLEPLPFRTDLPVKPRAAYLDRTDPNVAAIARYVLESALDSVSPADSGTGPRGAAASWSRPRSPSERRCSSSATGSTWSCPAGTAHASWWPRTPRCSPTVASRPPPNGCRPTRSLRCWRRCRPTTSSRTRPSTSPNAPWPPWTSVLPHLNSVADDLAVNLRDDHIRVREAGGQRVRRQIAVRAQKPADILGVYVYLPGGAA